ncbi:MAG: hypothetical protein FJ149_08490 [Euryarchaeota archaeon]|nr:hypothetical protein [Euryarchaeota archaeon]
MRSPTAVPAALLLAIPLCALLAAPATAAPGDPSVAIDYPQINDVVAGRVNVSGTSAGAQHVNVSIDGGGWNRATGSGSWQWEWDTAGYPDGTHTVLAVAVNGSRTSGTVSVQVSVNNSPPAYITLSLDLESATVHAGEQLAAFGLARFDTGVPVRAAVRLTFGNATWNATTDRRGYYSATLVAPAAAGEQAVKAFVTASGLSASVDRSVTVAPAASPDLSVAAADMAFAPAQPFSDEDVTVRAIVRNAGAANATARAVFGVTGLPNSTVDIAVPAGGTANPSVVWRLPAGTHNVSVSLTGIAPADPNASDDRAYAGLVVLSRPDLVLSAVVASNSRPVAGLNITLQARVNNTGDREASGTVRFYDGPPATGRPLGAGRVVVPAGGSASAYISWNATGEGAHDLHAVVADVSPREASELNNQASLTVTVRPRPAAPEPGGAIPGGWAASLLPALLGPAALRRAKVARHGRSPGRVRKVF